MWLPAGIVLLALAATVVAGWILVPHARLTGQIGPVSVAIEVPAEYRSIIRRAATRCPEVPARVLAAQIAAESGWDPRARSAAGARGIAQFMPKTWRQYGVDANGDGRANVWDPIDAITSAAELNCLNLHLVRSVPGDRLTNALAAYNAGHMAVRRYGGVPPFPETEAYVARILTNARTIRL